MKLIQGQNRNQIHLYPVSLDQGIDPDNEVRIIDLFVESLPGNREACKDKKTHGKLKN